MKNQLYLRRGKNRSASSLVVRMDASQAFDPGPNPG